MSTEAREFDIEGMTCAACVGRVERVIKKVPGVEDATVNLATHRATIRVAADIDAEKLIAAVERAGYGAKPHVDPFTAEDLADDAPETPPEQTRRWSHETLRAAAALPASLVLMVVSMTPGLSAPWFECALAVAVVWGAGLPIMRVALTNARHLSATMDTLIALGANAALAHSLWTLTSGHAGHGGHAHLYFETAAMIVAFVLLGRALEARARRSTGDALRALVALRPRKATVVRAGVAKEIAVSRVRVGDRVRVGANARIPVDGVVREGSSHVDLSMLTGESMPVARTVGDDVAAGTVNGESPIEVDATRVGAETALAQIVRMVERAQGSRAPIQRAADRAAAVVVPAVIAAATLTLLGWKLSGHPLEHALLAAVSVLVVACPCALGLATPTAVIVGAGRAAERGILVRDAASLERAHALTDVIFDKTGTLTRGSPSVTDITAFRGVTEAEALGVAAALEGASEHPLAKAILAAAKSHGAVIPAVSEVVVVAAQGVRGVIDGAPVAVGHGALVDEALDDEARAALERLRAEGRTTAAVTRAGAVIAVIGMADPVRDESHEAVALLGEIGVAVHLVSGDHPVTVRAVARRLGIADERVHAGVLPGEKGAIVEALRAQGKVVAMVGDGVNDAPALASADVGFAMGGGTDVAIEAASVTLMRADPRVVVDAISLSRAVMRVIRQNLFWAFAYNAVGIPLAAFGVFERLGGPMLAAGAMAMSSVSVVSNSLRLKRAL
ncbi:MAG: heavy metal translocating P-type ATPase [Polyangiales bacterium]